MRGGHADLDHLRSQVPLPHTADELCAAAVALKLAPEDVLLAGNAAETTIKRLSDAGRLADYRVIHFATHGTLAGEIEKTSEPGLILTPPAEQTDTVLLKALRAVRSMLVPEVYRPELHCMRGPGPRTRNAGKRPDAQAADMIRIGVVRGSQDDQARSRLALSLSLSVRLRRFCSRVRTAASSGRKSAGSSLNSFSTRSLMSSSSEPST